MSVAPPSAAPPVATADCEACGRPFDVRKASCPRCGFPRGGAAADLGRPIGAKSPRTAMWLSLAWPGAGHLYGRDQEKGLVYCAVSALAILVTGAAVGAGLAVIVWLGLALYTAIDAGRLVSGLRDR